MYRILISTQDCRARVGRGKNKNNNKKLHRFLGDTMEPLQNGKTEKYGTRSNY